MNQPNLNSAAGCALPPPNEMILKWAQERPNEVYLKQIINRQFGTDMGFIPRLAKINNPEINMFSENGNVYIEMVSSGFTFKDENGTFTLHYNSTYTINPFNTSYILQQLQKGNHAN